MSYPKFPHTPTPTLGHTPIKEAGRPRIYIPVNGVRARALIDSGSTYTLISSELYNKLPRLTPLSVAPTMLSVTNHEVPTIGACLVRIASQIVQAVVCTNLDIDVLIGADLLQYCVIDFPNKVVNMGDQKFPMDLSTERFAAPSVSFVVPKAPSDVVQQVLNSYSSVFSQKSQPVKVATSLPPVEIITTCDNPIRQQPYRIPLSKREIVEKCVQEMLDDDIIEPSDSPWSSPINLIPKRNQEWRFCVDYRRLNSVTRKDSYPIPNLKDLFDQLQGACIFSTLDLKSGYWQMPMAESSIPKTAFTCHLGLFAFKRLPFGLTNGPALFQRSMNKVLSGLIGKCCIVYIDDVCIFSKTVEEHAEHLRLVLQRLKEAGLQVKPSKCHFEKPEIELLGFVVSKDGIRPLPDKVKAIAELAPPTDVKGVRMFIGMINYYRENIKNFSTISLPLTELTKTRQPFIWGEEQQEAFDKLKQALTTAPILAHPDRSKPYILYTDASDKAIGAILCQKDEEGVERVISYLSHKLSEAQLRYPPIEKEALAIIYSLKKLHPYLYGAKFEIHTDHKPLKSLFTAEIKNSKLQRWAIQIAEYGAPILYHPGKLNVRADMLSRIAAISPAPPEVQLATIPSAWEADQIDPQELLQFQREQFPNEIIEARQDWDESCYFLEQGLLHSLAQPYKNAGRYPRLVLPQQYRQRVIDRCHKDVAHSAFDKTLARVQEAYVWPGMRKHVREYLKTCTHCNTMTPPHRPVPRGEVPTPNCLWEAWSIDLVGPFPRDQRGRTFLLTCVEMLSGWAEAFAIRGKKNKYVWEVLANELIPRYGIPKVLLSDNGGEFVATAFEEWLREFGIEHKYTSPYHPSCNGQCEVFNRTLQSILLKLSGGNPRKWSTYLPDALYAYRITKGPSGLSPYLAVHGQLPRLPRCPPAPQEPGERLRNLHAAAEVLKEFRAAQKTKYRVNQSPRARPLKPGALVSMRVRNPRKGTPKWRPGYQVLDARGPALVLRDVSSKQTVRVNQSDVREIPVAREYDEIDPLPPKNRRRAPKEVHPEEARPIPVQTPEIPLIPHIPGAAAISPTRKAQKAFQSCYCAFVSSYFRNNFSEP